MSNSSQSRGEQLKVVRYGDNGNPVSIRGLTTEENAYLSKKTPEEEVLLKRGARSRKSITIATAVGLCAGLLSSGYVSDYVNNPFAEANVTTNSSASATEGPNTTPTSPTPVPSPTPTQITEEEAAKQCIAEQAPETNVAQVIMPGIYPDSHVENPEYPVVTSSEMGKFDLAPLIGGILYMEQTSEKELKSITGNSIVKKSATVDDEGGNPDIDGVLRNTYANVDPLPSAYDAVALEDTEYFNWYDSHVQNLIDNGYTGNFGTVADSGKNHSFKRRVASSDADTVIAYGDIRQKVAVNHKLTEVIKHFPGGSGSNGNTDFDNTVEADPSDEDLRIFRELVQKNPNAKLMMANTIAKELFGNKKPASLNKAAYKLAKDYGYTTPMFTDSLSTAAILDTLTLEEAVLQAIKAGAHYAVFVPKNIEDIVSVINHVAEAIELDKTNKNTINKRVYEQLLEKLGTPREITTAYCG